MGLGGGGGGFVGGGGGGGALALYQNSNGGVDLYMGPELISSLGSPTEGACIADSMSCESIIQDYSTENQSHARRQDRKRRACSLFD